MKCELMLIVYCAQRDLDFTVDLDFHGELSELVDTMHYKMRQPVILVLLHVCHTRDTLLSAWNANRSTSSTLYGLRVNNTIFTGLDSYAKMHIQNVHVYVFKCHHLHSTAFACMMSLFLELFFDNGNVFNHE